MKTQNDKPNHLLVKVILIKKEASKENQIDLVYKVRLVI